MKSRSIFIIGTFSILSLLGLILVNTKSMTERNLNYLRESEKENKQSFQGAAEYYKILKADPTTGVINPAYVIAAQKQLNMMSKSRAGIPITWEFRGPDNVGGRSRILVIDNQDHNILYAGGVSGGIFKSTNGGESWEVKTYNAEMGGLIISCGAQAANGDIYFGTGEQLFTTLSIGEGFSGSQGGGIYKSTDRGENWTRLASTNPASFSRFYNVPAIAINPKDGTIYAATQLGLVESSNGGTTWTNYPGDIHTVSSTSYIDVKVSSDGNTVYAAISSAGGCKLYRSKNHDPLVQVGAGTLSQSTLRFVIAISPSNPNYVYVSSAASGSGNGWGSEALDGIYRSTDNGDIWTKIVLGKTEAEPFASGGAWQGRYDNYIAVDPYNPNRFFLGGVDFYMFEDGMWYKAAGLNEFQDAKEIYVNPYYIHADKHYITFDTVSKPYKMFVTTDGGVAVSQDAQNKRYPTYKTININYTTTQFYAIGASRYDDVIGGTQDNGTFVIENNSLTGKSGKEILGGDGFFAEISNIDPNTFITESYYGLINRSKDRGTNQQTLLTGKLKPSLKPNNMGTYPWSTPIRLWEDTIHQEFIDSTLPPPYKFDSLLQISKLFFAPINEVWLNLKAHDFSSDAVDWFKISNSSMNLYALCMEYTKDGNTLFIGGTNYFGGSTGLLYRITGIKNATYKFDGNGNFDPDAAGIKTELIKQWSSRAVTGIGISPGNNNNIVVTLGNYVGTGFDHVYLSTNAFDSIVSFTSIQGTGSGKLPYMPIYDAAIHSFGNGTDSIIIATEMGVFTTIDGGTNWTETNDGMARVPTYQIRQIHVQPWHNGFKYYIGTHGRGIFSSVLCDFFSIPDKSSFMKPDMSVYPNPTTVSTTVNFNLTKTSNITIQVFDLNGRIIQTYNFKLAKAGKNTYPLNTSTFKPGTYIVRATIEGQYLTSKLMITK